MDPLSTGSERTNIDRVATAVPFTLNTFSLYKTLLCFFNPTGFFFGGAEKRRKLLDVRGSSGRFSPKPTCLGFAVCEVTHVYFSSPFLGYYIAKHMRLWCCCFFVVVVVATTGKLLSQTFHLFFSFRSYYFIFIENSLLLRLLSKKNKKTNHSKEHNYSFYDYFGATVSYTANFAVSLIWALLGN